MPKLTKLLLQLVLLLGTLTAAARPGDAHIWLKYRRTGAKPKDWTPPGQERLWGQWNELNFERTDGKNFTILNMRYHEELPPELINADGTLKLKAPPGFEYGDYVENDNSASLPDLPQFKRMKFNNPGLEVPVGVGLTCCPLVLDYDGDGKTDLLLSCECRRWNTTHFFRNLGRAGESDPVFAKGVKVGPSGRNPVYTSFNGIPLAQAGRTAYFDFTNNVFLKAKTITFPDVSRGRRINEMTFTYRDYDGDGRDELVVAADVWENVRWDDAYDSHGVWTGGCIKGWTWIARNREGNINLWGRPEKLVDVNGQPLTTMGSPRSMLQDFDGDGDLDMIATSFSGGFTYFENVGTRTQPKYVPGRPFFDEKGCEITADSPLSNPVACDWNGDGRPDIVCGDESGQVALIENTGNVMDGLPVFKSPRYFRQQADELKFGVLATPVAVDWDGDGDLDFIAGNAAGYIGFIENLSGDGVENPRFAAPVPLSCELPKNGEYGHPDIANRKHTIISLDPFRIMAGPSGSIQGPRESAWGYVCLSVADWDGDGLLDVMINNTLGRIFWFKNVGTRTRPRLMGPLDVEVEWRRRQPRLEWGWMTPEKMENPKSILTQWRTTPVMADWNDDGLMDILLSDAEGYLCLWRRGRREDGTLCLNPPERVFYRENGTLFRLAVDKRGRSGRVKLCLVDWDGDGRLDIMQNYTNAKWWKQVRSEDGKWYFRDMGAVAPNLIQWHSTSPCATDFDADGIPDLVCASEDGMFYYLRNPRSLLKTAGRDDQVFSREQGRTPRKVTFDRHGRTLVDGMPFFPIGMFAGEMNSSNVARYAESVFNCVMPYRMPTKAVMDDCWERGIRVIYDMRSGVTGWDGTDKNVKSPADELFWLRQKVAEFGSHPGLLAWYTNDEFDIKDIKHLTSIYRMLAQLDSNHPVFTCIYQVPDVPGYLPSLDVIGSDPYPIDEAPLSLVTDWTRKTKKGAKDAKPVWQAIQAFDWTYYRKKRGASLDGLRFPTREEMENMGWQAIAAGANGLLFYAFHDVFRNDPGKAVERWNDVKYVARAIRSRESTLLAADGPVPAISGETETIAARAYNEKGRIKLLVVNAAREAQSASLDVGVKSVKISLAPMEAKWLEL